MSDLKTVEGSVEILDPLYQKQKEGVAKMRTSLLACMNDSSSAQQALQNITVLRVYHQINRIIRYLELMDKLEEKLYSSIDATIESSNVNNPSTWMMLLSLQERLQKSMIESHKLLQPYLDIQEFKIVDIVPDSTTPHGESALILNSSERDKIRSSAQSVLAELSGEADG